MAATDTVRVAIIGGGFSGTAVAWQLLRLAAPEHALELTLIERQPAALGRGVAYATRDPLHLLNTPAGEMSLDPQDPQDLLRWWAAAGGEADARAFLPRGTYGDYLVSRLNEAVEASPARFRVVPGEVVGLLPEPGGFRLRLADGACLNVEQVVLALGLRPPGSGAWGLTWPEQAPWFEPDPWAPSATRPLPAGEEALLLGTGLTAIDVALRLLGRSEAGRVTLLSRRGQVPPAWQVVGVGGGLDVAALPTRMSQLCRQLRAQVAWEAQRGASWQAVLDSWRPDLNALWQRLPLVERRRFLRHAKGWWEQHRQRLAPPVAAAFERARAEGRLVVQPARVQRLRPSGEAVTVEWRSPHGLESRQVSRVVVCTGPDGNHRRNRHPLVLDLLGTGLARLDPLHLGLDVDEVGCLRDEDGLPSRGLWALGPLRKGGAWESTAVPELARQAAAIAHALLPG
ncbi:MAG: FAD/NAD(P)-binding protein [Candidatus Sericytochromatia bacterium]|nr:FAD/NAD(P)-binding protein [Candidatus Sericytochromatia bacterium]